MVRTDTIKQELLTLLIIALLSYAIGGLINVFRDEPLGVIYEPPARRLVSDVGLSETDPSDSVKTATEGLTIHEQIRLIEQPELVTWMQEGKAIILDVRPNLFYQIGHIKGAINLQIKEFEQDYKKHKELLKSAKPTQKEVVLYCAGPHCPDASKIASELKALGYVNLCVYEGGWEHWEAAGLPSESTL